jgi:uncharacterized delta-60 repeat protein
MVTHLGRSTARQDAGPSLGAAVAPSIGPSLNAVDRRWPVADKPSRVPAIEQFDGWLSRYAAAAPAQKSALISEGVMLAGARREALAQLIRTDPRESLARAVPMTVRQTLPAEVVELLEERISARGELALNAVTPERPGEPVAEPFYRSVLVEGREYRAYVYGRRAQQATVGAASLVGIAVDSAMAVSESPVRVLEPGEVLTGKPVVEMCSVSQVTTAGVVAASVAAGGPTPVEYDGHYEVLCGYDHVAKLEQRLIAREISNLDAADSGPGTSNVSGRPTTAWSQGSKTLLIIRVDFSDLPGTPKYGSGSTELTDTEIVKVINQTNGVRDFYVAGSFGKTDVVIRPVVNGVSPDVTPTLRMPDTAESYATAYNNTKLHSDARAAAQAAGYAVSSYARIGVVFSRLSSIPGSKITYGGLGNVIGANFWVNGSFDFRVVAHEIGHNYGLWHSNRWQVTDGNPVSPSGTLTEYGDASDVMGLGSSIAQHFSHWNKNLLRWVPDEAITSVLTSGTYRVYRFDHASANLTLPRGLKIVRDSSNDYWIGYRRGTTNASMNGGAYVLWGHNTNTGGVLLDMTTPGVDPSGVRDEGLAIGATFTDSVAGISLRPVAQGGSGADEYLDVQVTLQPQITWAETTRYVAEQAGSVALTLQRARNSTGRVTVNWSTASGTATAPGDFSAASGTVVWETGDAASKTISIPIISDAVVESDENFTVNLSGIAGGVLTANTTATVRILDAGRRDPSYTTGFVNSEVRSVVAAPDGSAVIGGWFTSVADGAGGYVDRRGITQLSTTGALLSGFAAAGGYGSGQGPVYDIARQTDGKYVVVGSFTTFHGVARNNIARLNPDGTLDTSFNPGTGANAAIYTVLVGPDEKIYLGGTFTTYNGTAREYLARLNPDGSLDTSFVPPDFGGGSGWRVQCLAFQPDGKLLVGGQFYFSGTQFKSSLCRLLANGALDSTFSGVTSGAHTLGSTNSPQFVYRIAVNADGTILIAGNFSAYNGVARGGLARLTSTGALDTSFAPAGASGGSNICYTLLPLSDGSMIVGGVFPTFNGVTSRNLAKVGPTGVLDSAFSAAGGFGAAVYDLAPLADGRVLLGGGYAAFQDSTSSGPIWAFWPGAASAPSVIQLQQDVVNPPEGTAVTLTVTRSGGTAGPVSVPYSTVAGSATTADFQTTAGSLTWVPGETGSKTISIPISWDGLSEGTEFFTVNLGSPTVGSAILGPRQRTVVVIQQAPEELYLNKTFSRVLGRAPSAADLAAYGAALLGGRSRDATLVELLASPEHERRQLKLVIRLYLHGFLRAPDYAGLMAWSQALRNGQQTPVSVAQAFATSAEFLAKYGQLTDTQFVQQLYRNVLGREADSAGLASWVSRLSGGTSRGEVFLGFSESAEAKARVDDQVEILHLYSVLLGRVPGPAEIRSWLDFLRGHGLTNAFLGSPEFAARYPGGLSDAAFVDLAFRGFLRRGADSGALAAYSGGLSSGQLSRAGVVDSLLSSAEFGSFVDPVARQYLAGLQRPPDGPGLTNWSTYVRGQPLATMANAMASSSEFLARYGGLSNQAYVRALYENVLGRSPDAAGLAGWTGQLDANTNTRGGVLLAFTQSAESINLYWTDVRSSLHYLTFLDRVPSLAERASWFDYLTTLRQQMRRAIIDSPEFNN